MANPKGNPENLKPIRSTDEARKRGSAGGKASGAARRKKRDLKSAVNLLLNLPAGGNLDENLISLGYEEEDRTNMNALVARMFTSAIAGDKESQRMLLKYGGFDPEQTLRERESKARIKSMQAESERRAMYRSDDDDDQKDVDDVQIYLPDNGRGDGPGRPKEPPESDEKDGEDEDG